MKTFRVLVLFSAVVCSATSSFAGYQIFLKLGDIKGQATDASHKDWIELSSYSMSPTQGLKQVTLQGPLAPWNPQVALAAAQGTHFTSVVLDAGPTRYTFSGAIVSSYSAAGQGSESPRATFTLQYMNAAMTTQQRPNTTPAAPSMVAATLVNPSVTPVPANAQVFVDGMPSDRFTLLGFERRGTVGVMQVKNVQGNGYFAANKKKNTKVNVKASAGQFLEMQMTDCIITSYVSHADGTATATLNFSAYTGPVTVRP